MAISDDPAYPRIDVYGSLDELERDFGVRPTDLHRPAIDDLVATQPRRPDRPVDDAAGARGARLLVRVGLDAVRPGALPVRERRSGSTTHSPADFIVEYIAQTRGWFYTLHVLSTALFDRPAFTNVICHGVVLAEDGRKLSKRLRNYPDPDEVMETIGSDALRWFLMASPILRGGDLQIDAEGSGIADVVRLVLNPIWNAFHFFTLYANADGHRATFRTDSTDTLDRYLLAKTRSLVEAVTDALDAYDIAGACNQVNAFLDALNNWYIRRSRERFWAPGSTSSAGGDVGSDKADAFDTLYTVLVTLSKVLAPLLPFVAEEIYTSLTDERVRAPDRLARCPESLPADPELVPADGRGARRLLDRPRSPGGPQAPDPGCRWRP